MSTLAEAAHAMQCPMCQRGEPCEAAAVDATLGVTAELARVTAERDELKTEVANLSRLVARQADLLTAAVNALKGEPPELVLWSHHDVGELAAAMMARAEKAEAELERERMRLAACGVVAMSNTPESAEKNRAMHADYLSASLSDVIRAVDSEIALRAQVQRLEGTLAEQARALEELTKVCEVAKEDHGRQVAALLDVLRNVHCHGNFLTGRDVDRHDAIIDAALADTNLGADWVPRAELVEAEKQIAAWRVLAERARKHLTEATHSEDCARTDECDEADPGECGQCPGPCQPCDCGLSPIQATAGELYAALADPNLGHDYVPRAELQRQYAENISGREQQHHAELRRVAEAVRKERDEAVARAKKAEAERDAAWERLDEFGSGGLVYGIARMRAALIDARCRAEKAEKERDELRHRLDCVPPNMSNAMNQIDVLARQRDEAQKANAALRAVVADERAYELQLCQYCAHCGQSQLSRCEAEPTCHEREQEWWNVIAALADPNLGHDYVPRAELQRQYAENISGREQQHHAELRRIAEAVLDRVFDLLSNACLFEEHQGIAVARRYVNDVRRDLDAIVRGGQ